MVEVFFLSSNARGRARVRGHTQTHVCAGAPPALPSLAGGTGGPGLSQLSGYSVQPRSWVHPKPLFHKAQQQGKRGVHVYALLGGGYFGNPRLSYC